MAASIENLQEKMAQLEYLKEQADLVQQQAGLIAKSLTEIDMTIGALGELKKMEKSTSFLIPFGTGVLAKASLEDNGKVLVNVGSGVMAEKTVDEALEMIAKQKRLLEQAQEGLMKAMGEINQSARTIAPEAKKLADQLKR